jgi:hypothetical protein
MERYQEPGQPIRAIPDYFIAGDYLKSNSTYFVNITRNPLGGYYHEIKPVLYDSEYVTDKLRVTE